MRLETLADGFGFTEGLRWHDGRLWFSDFNQRRVRTLDLSGQISEMAYVPGQPSGLGFTPDGTPWVVSMLDRRLMRIETGLIHEVANLGRHAVGLCNDMVMDSRGNAYISTMGYDFYREARLPGLRSPILRVSASGQIAIAAPGLSGPNGIALIDDEQTLVVAETHANRLTAFDIRADGLLDNRRVFANLGDVMPDGLCADADGNLWVAGLYSNKFLLVRAGGTIIAELPTPGRWAVSCALNPDGRHLFCGTATIREPADARSGRSTSAIEWATLGQ